MTKNFFDEDSEHETIEAEAEIVTPQSSATGKKKAMSLPIKLAIGGIGVFAMVFVGAMGYVVLKNARKNDASPDLVAKAKPPQKSAPGAGEPAEELAGKTPEQVVAEFRQRQSQEQTSPTEVERRVQEQVAVVAPNVVAATPPMPAPPQPATAAPAPVQVVPPPPAPARQRSGPQPMSDAEMRVGALRMELEEVRSSVASMKQTLRDMPSKAEIDTLRADAARASREMEARVQGTRNAIVAVGKRVEEKEFGTSRFREVADWKLFRVTSAGGAKLQNTKSGEELSVREGSSFAGSSVARVDLATLEVVLADGRVIR